MPIATDNAPYECKLPIELQLKAERELNENPATRHKKIEMLRDLTQTRPDIKFRRDDAFLLRFLRAKKFDVKRAFQNVIRYYEVKREYPEVFDDLMPSKLTHVWEDGYDGVLPCRDKDGRRLMVIRPGKWNPDKSPSVDSIRANVITMERMLEDEETQVNGIIAIGDFVDYSMKQAKHIGPYFARMNINITQNAMPLRIKALHFINTPKIFEAAMSLWKPLMSEKMRQRMHVHGDEFGTLHDYIPSNILPSDFGGTLPQFNDHAKEWMHELLSWEEQFIYNNETFGPTKKKHALGGQQIGSDPNMGLVGNFKKLDV